MKRRVNAVEVAEAMLGGGIDRMEVPLTSPDPGESIRRVVDGEDA